MPKFAGDEKSFIILLSIFVGSITIASILANKIINGNAQTFQKAAQVLATQSPQTDPVEISDAGYLSFIRDKFSTLAGYNPQHVSEA